MSNQPRKQLKIKTLGGSGVKVSELCLGAMTFSSQENGWLGMPSINPEESVQLLDLFVEYGGNFIDTANVYGYGQSERIIGDWMESRNNRKKIIVATKFAGKMSEDHNDFGGSRKHIIDAVTDSLIRLKTSYIDLYQMHSFDFTVDQKETLNTLNDLVRGGLVRYIGCSNFTASQLQYALDYAKFSGLEPYVSLQPQYSLLCRSTEYELIPVCQQNNLGVLPWSPLKGGWLSGKYTKDQQPEEGRVNWAEKKGWLTTNYSYWNTDFTWNLLDVIKRIAKDHNATMAQVSLRWMMQKPYVTAPIIGVRTVEQLHENVGSAFINLTDEEMKALDEASEVNPPPYPYDSMKRMYSQQKNYLE